ncbi:DUF6262 family protein [Nonomuraea sp. KM88]|uniref:DUF6262 family protein n=1 Tax=Nonomuraea sp. KM88 TaxID=3457427 RepID=UPI003FCDDBBD
MSADNLHHLVLAARRRHELTRAKAIQALRELEVAVTPVTFDSVARHGQISRSWLYTQPDLRAEIQRLRDTTRRRSDTPSIPARQRASDDSLRRRLEIAYQRNRELAEENKRLRRQLARALGDQRVQQSPAGHRDTATIDPR